MAQAELVARAEALGQGDVAQKQAALAQRQALLQQQANAGNLQPAEQAQIAVELKELQQQRQQLQAANVRQITVVEQVEINDNGVLRVVRRARRVPATAPIDMLAAEQQHVWTSALENTLSPEQKKLLAAANADRINKQAADTPTARIVGQIDQLLQLDPTQREKFTELVTAALELPAFKVQVQRTPQLTPAMIDRVIKRLPAAEINAMLTQLQAARWQQAVLGSLAQSEGVMTSGAFRYQAVEAAAPPPAPPQPAQAR
jgi:hypothetical protein